SSQVPPGDSGGVVGVVGGVVGSGWLSALFSSGFGSVGWLPQPGSVATASAVPSAAPIGPDARRSPIVFLPPVSPHLWRWPFPIPRRSAVDVAVGGCALVLPGGDLGARPERAGDVLVDGRWPAAGIPADLVADLDPGGELYPLR